MELTKEGIVYTIDVGDVITLKSGSSATIVRIAKMLDGKQRFEVRINHNKKFDMITEDDIKHENIGQKLINNVDLDIYDEITRLEQVLQNDTTNTNSGSYTPVITRTEEGSLKELVINNKPKTKFSLLPQAAMKEVADVLTMGAEKYDEYNFSKGAKDTTYIDAALRHINTYLMNEDIDLESKKHHLAHAAADILMTLDNILIGKIVDGRNKVYKTNKD